MATQTYHRGLRDLQIASWTSENSYGTAYDVKGARDMSISWVVETDQAEGDDVVLDQFTKIIAVTVQIEQAAVDIEVLDIISGGVLVSNASYEDLIIGGDDDIPYVALAGKVQSSTGSESLQVFVPKAKVSGNVDFRAQYGQYVFPTAEFRGVDEGSTNGIIRFRKFLADTAVEIPLRTTTGSS